MDDLSTRFPTTVETETTTPRRSPAEAAALSLDPAETEGLTPHLGRCLSYPVDMSDTKNPVYLDADLLARLEGLADEAGVDRDTYVEDALRRYLAGRDLVALQREISSRTGLAFEDALDLVYAERDAVRAERASGEAAGSQPR